MASSAAARIPVELSLRVWGMGADGKAFSQQARVCNISPGGALISELQQELKIGDTIGVQYGGHKARCRVVWTSDTNSAERIRAGVELLQEKDCPWAALLAGSAPISPPGQRRWPRHKISVLIALHDEWSRVPMRVTATDISACGCYVETILPGDIGTRFNADLWIGEEKLTTPVLVRTRDPGVGMGIEFVGLKPEDQQRFQGYLQAMDPWGCSIER